jgi:squalene cyclase
MDALVLVPLALSLAGRALSEATAQEFKRANPENRALAYLVHEVPRWSRENKCYSCHNNGDAARVLYTAIRLSLPVPPQALADTSRWLARPQQWDHNGGEGPFSDKKLARIQFAAALVEAVNAGQVHDRQALKRAAELVVEHQEKDGSWQVDAPGTIGSPATYGACLATYQARRVLQAADPVRYRAAITRADQWLRNVPVNSVLDAAAILLALGDSEEPALRGQQQKCLALIRQGESKKGGWGPYPNSPPEPFDTAVVLLALGRSADGKAVAAMIRRGRGYLVSGQQPDGSWQETTRPAGSESYAQRVSTTAWATHALLATR